MQLTFFLLIISITFTTGLQKQILSASTSWNVFFVEEMLLVAKLMKEELVSKNE